MRDEAYRRSRLDALLRGSESDSPTGGDQRVGDYRLLRRLGAGGMGVVWLARDERLDRLAAVKLLAPHLTIADEAAWRFGQEATATARLDHPAIVAVHGAGEFDGQRYLAMELVDGVPLDRLLASLAGRRPEVVSDTDVQAIVRAELSVGPYGDSPFTEWTAPSDRVSGWFGRVARWGCQAADGLHHAHSRGVLHRDIKPSNLIVDRSGDIRIVDFGLARIEQAAPITRTGALLGTIAYMAPEGLVAQGEDLDARADVYSLGATLFELLALRPPYVAASLSALVSEISLNEAPSVARFQANAPRDLAAVISKCLARDRRDRYSTAQDLAEDLRQFLAGEGVRARPPGTWRRLRAWGRTHPRQAAAGGLLLAAVVAAGPTWSWAVRRSALLEAGGLRAEGLRQLGEAEALVVKGVAARAAYDAHLASIGGSPRVTVSFCSTEKRLADALAELRLQRGQALEASRYSLENAAAIESRFGGETDATRTGRLRMALIRLRDARAEYDGLTASFWRDYGRRVVGSATPPTELGDAGTIQFRFDPPGSVAHLFRYEPHDRVSGGRPVVSRLVPVPVDVRDGTSRVDAIGSLLPGDPCLVIATLEESSPLAAAGLQVGDLITAVDGRSPRGGAFVASVQSGGLADVWGVGPWDRITEVDPVSVESHFEWRTLDRLPAPGSRRVAIAPHGGIWCERGGSLESALGISVVGPDALWRCAPRRTVQLDVVTSGGARRIALPAGRAPGARLTTTAYPLACTPTNRVADGERTALPEGSYVALVRRAGSEDQRLPFVVHVGDDRVVRVTLRPEGSTPDGWCFVPECDAEPEMRENVWIEGEPAALEPAPRIPDFVIAQRELTLGEWFEFLNAAPGVRESVVEALRERRRPPLVPRSLATDEYDVAIAPDGALIPAYDPTVPLYGVSGVDLAEFLRWKNARLRSENSPWLWDLPSPSQWIKAARGADRRRYPWGDRFYHSLCVNGRWPGEAAIDTRPHEEPRDESPFGVWDMAGSREEWCRGTQLRGGDWSMSDAADFRIALATGVIEKAVSRRYGFRPVLVENPDHAPK